MPMEAGPAGLFSTLVKNAGADGSLPRQHPVHHASLWCPPPRLGGLRDVAPYSAMLTVVLFLSGLGHYIAVTPAPLPLIEGPVGALDGAGYLLVLAHQGQANGNGHRQGLAVGKARG